MPAALTLSAPTVCHPLTNTFALELGNESQHSEEHLRSTALSNGFNTHINKDEVNTASFEPLGRDQSVTRRPEQSIQLICNDAVALLGIFQHPLSGRALT